MNYFNFSHSSGLKPTRTKLSVTTNGRFTNLPLVANSAICSSSLIAGSFSLSFSSLYTNPLVLKNFFTGRRLPVKKFFNTSGLVYKELKLSEKLPAMSEEEQIALLATNGKLVKRPLVVTDSFVLVGFKPDEWEKLK